MSRVVRFCKLMRSPATDRDLGDEMPLRDRPQLIHGVGDRAETVSWRSEGSTALVVATKSHFSPRLRQL